MSDDGIECPPWEHVDAPLPDSPTILDYAAAVQAAVNRYRCVVDVRGDFRATVSAASNLARASQALATAIADAVAMSDSAISRQVSSDNLLS